MTEQRSVLAGVPVHYQCEPKFVMSLLAAWSDLPQLGVRFDVRMHMGESLITRARNRIVSAFLKTDNTHLLFVDADESFLAKDILGMLDTGHPLVGALVPKKGINWGRVREMAQAGAPVEDIKALSSDVVINTKLGERPMVNGCAPVDALGTGFMLIHRSVFEKMIAEFGEDIAYVSDTPGETGETLYAFFDCAIHEESKRYLSEDYTFSHRAKALGIQPYAYVDARVSHIGAYEYFGNAHSIYKFRTG